MIEDEKRQRAEEMANAIPQVLDALVGSTACHADTALDNESLANVEKLQAVAEWLKERLYRAYRSIESPYYSAKIVADSVIEACDGLDNLFLDMKNAYVVCPHCRAQFSVRMWCDEEPARCVACGSDLSVGGDVK